MLIGLLENAGKSVLATDPDTLSALSELSGQVIAFEMRQLNKTLYLRPVADGIEIEFDSDLEANVTFSAKPDVFFRLTKDGLENAEYAPGELEISGDALLGQRFAKTLSSIDIDWEELLSQHIGDVPARLVSKEIQSIFNWVNKLSSQTQQGLTEALINRTELLAKPDDVIAYLAEVDNLESQTERFEAKLRKFEDSL
jgi:ubiquinone biosynthesis accessory factor UbiJ